MVPSERRGQAMQAAPQRLHEAGMERKSRRRDTVHAPRSRTPRIGAKMERTQKVASPDIRLQLGV